MAGQVIACMRRIGSAMVVACIPSGLDSQQNRRAKLSSEETTMTQKTSAPALFVLAILLAGCASPRSGPEQRTASITRTANGVAHISAPDAQTLAYGVAYAHAQDNVCQSADQLVTVRGQRSRHFGGGTATSLIGRRVLPNELIDVFVAAYMDDAKLDRQWATTSAEAQALARGYVAGYNRYLADHAGKLPAACNGKPWVQPMTPAEYRRLMELVVVQASSAALTESP
jgi:acyl-homoserine-lactone acylase